MPIDAQMKLELCRQICLYRRRQELLIQTTADSALIAAQQVQDKQIELLRTPAAFTPGDAMIEVLLSFVPFSTLAGTGLSMFLSATLNHVLRTRVAFAMFSKSQMGLWLEGATKASIERIRKNHTLNDFDKGLLIFGEKQAQGGLLNTQDVRVFYSDFVQKLADGQALVTNATTIKASIDKIVQPELRALDTPGASLCDQALAFARQQTATQNFIYDAWLLEVQLDAMTPENALACYEYCYQANQHLDRAVRDVAAVRLRATRIFEMIIWNRIYPAVKWTFAGGDSALTSPEAGIPKVLSDYFVLRFFSGPDNVTYAEEAKSLVDAVINLAQDWVELSEALDSCSDRVAAAFRTQVV